MIPFIQIRVYLESLGQAASIGTLGFPIGAWRRPILAQSVKNIRNQSRLKKFSIFQKIFFQSLGPILLHNISKFQLKRSKNDRVMAIFVPKISEILNSQKKAHFTKSVLETKRLDQKSKYLGSEHVQGLGSGWA